MTQIGTTAHVPAPDAIGAPVSVTVQATLSEPVTGDTVTLTGPDGPVAGTMTASGTLRNFAPSAPLAHSTIYTVEVSGGRDAAGNVRAAASWSFTTAPEPVPGVSFYGDDAFMGGSFDDGVDYSLGGRLSFSGVQAVTHIRWWVPSGGQVPTAAGIYRDSDGVLVATGNLAGVMAPTGGGWVTIPLKPELVPEADTRYIPTVLIATQPRSYLAMLEAFTAGPVTRHGITYETGVFTVGSTLTKPTQTFHSASYGVDVLVRPVAPGAPTGRAGVPQTAVFADAVRLHGTASDDDGTITSWTWRQISGPTVTLVGIGPSPTFTAPSVPGLLVFGLTVTDNDGNTSAEDETLVAVHQNLAAAENLLPGTPKATWDVLGVGDPTILGYAWPYSVNAGQAVQFRVNGPATSIDVYRLGFYHGQGARLHASLVNTPAEQPKPSPIPGSNGGVECTDWTVTATWQVPVETVSGQFIAVVKGPGDVRSHIPFIVRNDDRRAAVVHKSADATWHAYNYFGDTAPWNQGACLYGRGKDWTTDTNRAYAVSWARPIVHRQDRMQTFLFNAEYPTIRFLEEAGLDVQYIGCQDLDRSADYLLHTKVFISSGHDEYWSQPMRDHATQARDAGVNLIFWSANEVFWRTRWDTESDPDRRVMWCYKDTMNGPSEGPDKRPAHEGGQPLDPVMWTGTFRDPRRPDGAMGEWLLTGTEFRMNGVSDRDAVINAAIYGASPFWRHTCLATGQDVILVGVLGFEADDVKPPRDGAVLLGDTETDLNGNRADDAGQTYTGSGTMRWGIVVNRYPSGSVVAGFGTVQWAWALSTVHDRQTSVPSQAARQATLNLLTDMGATPASVPSDLTKPNPVSWDAYGI